MVCIIETKQRGILSGLGKAVLEVIMDFNRDAKTDFKTESFKPRCIKSTTDYDEYIIGKFYYNFDRRGLAFDSDSVLAYRVKSTQKMGEEIKYLLRERCIKPAWIVTPGLGDTFP